MCFAKSWLLVAVIFASFLCFYLILNGKAWRISPVIPIRGDPRGYLGTGGGGWVSTLDYFPIEGSLGLDSGRGNAGSIVTPSPSNCPRSLRPWGCLNLIPQVWDFHSSILSIVLAFLWGGYKWGTSCVTFLKTSLFLIFSFYFSCSILILYS